MALQMILSITDAQLDEWIRAEEKAIEKLEGDDSNRETYRHMKHDFEFAKKFAQLLPEQKQQVRELEAQKRATFHEMFRVSDKAKAKHATASKTFDAKLKELGFELEDFESEQ